MKYYRKILAKEQCQSIIELVPTLSENVTTFANETIKRLHVSPEWHYNFYRLGKQEVLEHVEIIQEKLAFDITSFRVMHYPAGALMGEHNDSWHPLDGPSDCGMTIQLNNPTEYSGGDFYMNSKNTNLDIGDGIFYTYDEPHYVKKILHGERWIVSLRAKLR